MLKVSQYIVDLKTTLPQSFYTFQFSKRLALTIWPAKSSIDLQVKIIAEFFFSSGTRCLYFPSLYRLIIIQHNSLKYLLPNFTPKNLIRNYYEVVFSSFEGTQSIVSMCLRFHAVSLLPRVSQNLVNSPRLRRDSPPRCLTGF